ncbi:FAD-binding oxidoreductase [Pontibacter anaerobius]|uniref:FAD-dependent oxidoreductase n=1 Tax=Pontibacter anaerobius TaxID=2993940 RepID=A0ABT3REQ6_9BACT|nr:FAD-dependent oxidoreductase [Pontibacter anaerobius]MCX2739911.1 FAD-dependent oxidoreductase [Pontibacter anaerobius]
MKRLINLVYYLLTKVVVLVKTLLVSAKRLLLHISRKKRYAIPFYGFIAYVLFVVALVKTSGDANYNKVLANKRINDVTVINPIQVNKIIKPHTNEELIQAIQATSGPISIGGGKFSMGGQTGYENSLHIDTREFNKVIKLDTVTKQITVQPGITWRDLQDVIDPYDLSVKIMQTYANFTVGGSLSVNCHGRYIGHGPIISSVVGLKIITASGEIITASRSENPDVFNAAVGGYGGVGVIAEATLQLTDNVKVERHTQLVKVEEYHQYFNNNIRNDKKVIFQNGDLYPPDYDYVNVVSWKESDKPLTDSERFTSKDENYWLEQNLVEVVSWGDFGKWVRRSVIDPINYSTEKVTWRNKEASYDVKELEPVSREDETYVLQEYFIPVNRINSFVPKMKAVFDKYEVNVMNVSLRHAYPDTASFLSWANEEVFAFVVYYKQGTDQASKETVKQWTLEMTDAILSENGTWYLPYQPHASAAQFEKGYPNSGKYFEVKNKLDPVHRFTNKLLDKYNPYVTNTLAKEREAINGYYRAEEQTILTVPEWYLVFNPKEYADFLQEGNNPSDFPFYASIDEYWRLYDRSMKLVSDAYPENEEYNTMLQVIGVSITMEYAGKMIYENTIGRVFSWFSNRSLSEEEKTIIQAHRAYSDFIYDTAWYEFEFMPWVGKVWTVSDASEANWLRKWERALFFTLEFTFKAGYAQLIEWAAKSSYETPVTDVYLLVAGEGPTEGMGIKIIKALDDKKIISIPRWGVFTSTLLELKNTNFEIIEIGGNDEIAVSVLVDNLKSVDFDQVDRLYESRVVTKPNAKRIVYLLQVKELLPFLSYAASNHIEVEHMYDY